MKKIPIKVIKRKDVEAAAFAKIINFPSDPPPTALSEEKVARRAARDSTLVISKWIPESRHRRQTEIADAVRRLFGDDLPSRSS